MDNYSYEYEEEERKLEDYSLVELQEYIDDLCEQAKEGNRTELRKKYKEVALLYNKKMNFEAYNKKAPF